MLKRKAVGVFMITALAAVAVFSWWPSEEQRMQGDVTASRTERSPPQTTAVPAEFPLTVRLPEPDAVAVTAPATFSAPVVAEVTPSAATLSRYSDWLNERGYAFRVTGLGTTVRSMAGYDSMSLEDLKQLADADDRHAALLFGRKTLAGKDYRLLPPEQIESAIRYLRSASESGYVSSLDELIHVSYQRALAGDMALREWRVARVRYVIDMYMYAYVAERRASPYASFSLQMYRQGHPLTAEQDMQARAAADSFYADMQAARQKAGLPPFSDEVPEDIRPLRDRMIKVSIVPLQLSPPPARR